MCGTAANRVDGVLNRCLIAGGTAFKIRNALNDVGNAHVKVVSVAEIIRASVEALDCSDLINGVPILNSDTSNRKDPNRQEDLQDNDQ
jgi:hypothetical protein